MWVIRPRLGLGVGYMGYKAKARVRGRDIGVIRPRLGLGV